MGLRTKQWLWASSRFATLSDPRRPSLHCLIMGRPPAEDLEREALEAFLKIQPGFAAARDGESSKYEEITWNAQAKRYFGRRRGSDGSWKTLWNTSGATDSEAAYKLVQLYEKTSLKDWLQKRYSSDWLSQMQAACPGLVPRTLPPSQFTIAYYHKNNGRWHARNYSGNYLWEHLGVGGSSDAEVVYKAALKCGKPLKQFASECYLESSKRPPENLGDTQSPPKRYRQAGTALPAHKRSVSAGTSSPAQKAGSARLAVAASASSARPPAPRRAPAAPAVRVRVRSRPAAKTVCAPKTSKTAAASKRSWAKTKAAQTAAEKVSVPKTSAKACGASLRSSPKAVAQKAAVGASGWKKRSRSGGAAAVPGKRHPELDGDESDRKPDKLEPATQDDLSNVQSVLEIWTSNYRPKDLANTLKLRKD